jgi:hypothetical protein
VGDEREGLDKRKHDAHTPSSLCPPPSAALAARATACASRWPLRGGSGDAVTDLSPGGYHGYLLRPAVTRPASGEWRGAEEEEEAQEQRRAQRLGPRWVPAPADSEQTHAGGGEGRGGSVLEFDGSGAVFLPLAGLFAASQLSLTWRARLGCTHHSCGTQVMWSMHTIKGWMLRAEVSPWSLPRPGSGRGGPEGAQEEEDGQTGESGRTASVWVEVVLQRHPFTHVLASLAVPLAVLERQHDAERKAAEHQRDNRQGTPREPVSPPPQRWVSFSLSMSNDANEPILFAAWVDHDKAQETQGAQDAESARHPSSSGAKPGPHSQTWPAGNRAPLWRSWHSDAKGSSARQACEGGSRKACRAHADTAHVRREHEGHLDPGHPQLPCAYSSALDKTFIYGCAPTTAEDAMASEVEEDWHCPLAWPDLADAVLQCSQRHECGGITFSPRRGVFELRRGPQGVAGDSSADGEVSWLKRPGLCSPHVAVVPPDRCMTYSSPPSGKRTCNRWGAFLPFNFETGCTSRAFYLDESGRPLRRESEEEAESVAGDAVYRDSRGHLWSQTSDTSPGGKPLFQRVPAADGRSKSHGPTAASLDLRARFQELNWIVSLKGCSNDFWVLNMDGIAGVWLGSADGDERHTLANRSSIDSLAVWNAYWSLDNLVHPHDSFAESGQDAGAERRADKKEEDLDADASEDKVGEAQAQADAQAATEGGSSYPGAEAVRHLEHLRGVWQRESDTSRILLAAQVPLSPPPPPTSPPPPPRARSPYTFPGCPLISTDALQLATHVTQTTPHQTKHNRRGDAGAQTQECWYRSTGRRPSP